jgi:hypothetical protein
MLLSTKKVRSCVAADAEGNVYVAQIVTDEVKGVTTMYFRNTSDPTYACSNENNVVPRDQQPPLVPNANAPSSNASPP